MAVIGWPCGLLISFLYGESVGRGYGTDQTGCAIRLNYRWKAAWAGLAGSIPLIGSGSNPVPPPVSSTGIFP